MQVSGVRPSKAWNMFLVVVCGLYLFHVAGWCNFKILVRGCKFCTSQVHFCETSARKFCFPCDSCGFIMAGLLLSTLWFILGFLGDLLWFVGLLGSEFPRHALYPTLELVRLQGISKHLAGLRSRSSHSQILAYQHGWQHPKSLDAAMFLYFSDLLIAASHCKYAAGGWN